MTSGASVQYKPPLVTLYVEGTPVLSLVEGHIPVEKFLMLFREKWPAMLIRADGVSQEYWVNDQGDWRSSNRHDPRAVPVTVGEWMDLTPFPISFGQESTGFM